MKKDFSYELKEAIKVVRDGGVVLYPTDTIWGLGCDATNYTSIERIFEIKQRPHNKSMILLVDNKNKIPNYVETMPGIAWSLLELLTEPTTIIYPNGKNVASNAINQDKSIAIRVTKEKVSNSLCYLMGGPITSTSANISGEPYPKKFSEISDIIKKSVDYILPFFETTTNISKQSKIIKLGVDGQFRIIR